MSVTELPGAMLAPAKLNLCLYVGPKRDDGLHEIRSLFEPLELADELKLTEAPEDEVVIEGIEGPDLTAKALAALREHGWDGPPLRIEVTKRVPVAAGLGGGSADAAAVLRLARGRVEGLRAIAAGIGADVPSQLQPRACLVAGAGEVIEPVPASGRARHRPDPAGRGPGDGGGVRRGRPARHPAGRVRARGDPPPPARRGG